MKTDSRNVVANTGVDQGSVTNHSLSAADQVDPFDKNDDNLWYKIEHLGRYLFAADYLEAHSPATVADIACGNGYGVAELQRVARNVVGVDRNPDALLLAAERCSPANIELVNLCLDTGNLVERLGASSVQSIVCFETLEHLVDPGKTLADFSAILEPSGILICSVPNAIYESKIRAGLPANPFHKQLFTYSSFSRLLREHGFSLRYRVGQPLANTLMKRESDLLRRKITTRRFSDLFELHEPDMIRQLSYLFAYPSAQDVDHSYSIIVVVTKTCTSQV